MQSERSHGQKAEDKEKPGTQYFQRPRPSHPTRAQHLYRIEQKHEEHDKSEKYIVGTITLTESLWKESPRDNDKGSAEGGQQKKYSDEHP